MKQIFQLHEQTKQEVTQLEIECESLSEKLIDFYKEDFLSLNEMIVIDLVRNKKGKQASRNELFINDYESFLEIGIEKESEYFPNAYIPIWKCKQEMFHTVGYLTNQNILSIEEKLHKIIKEMLEDRLTEGANLNEN